MITEKKMRVKKRFSKKLKVLESEEKSDIMSVSELEEA